MAIDTAAKRMAAGGLPFPLGVNVLPGTLATDLGVAAAAWSYWPDAFVPGTGGDRDTFSLGVKDSIGITINPVLGGAWGQ